jgi:hypothetical protein
MTMTIAITMTREISFFISFSLKFFVFIQKIGPDRLVRADLKYTKVSNHRAGAITGRVELPVLIMLSIRTHSRTTTKRKLTKMDNATALSLVIIMTLLLAAELSQLQKEDAEANSFAIAHEPKVLKQFAKRSNIVPFSFLENLVWLNFSTEKKSCQD